jgi:hypothetical protein
VVHLDKGRLKIKVRGPSDKIEAFDMACEEVGGGAADYIPYWVEMWPSAVALAEHMASKMEIRSTFLSSPLLASPLLSSPLLSSPLLSFPPFPSSLYST